MFSSRDISSLNRNKTHIDRLKKKKKKNVNVKKKIQIKDLCHEDKNKIQILMDKIIQQDQDIKELKKKLLNEEENTIKFINSLNKDNKFHFEPL